MARVSVVWPYLAILKNVAPNLRLIFNTVDLHYIRELRQAELANDAAAREAALVTRAHEFEIIEKCDLTILLSQEEMYAVREINPEAPVASCRWFSAIFRVRRNRSRSGGTSCSSAVFPTSPTSMPCISLSEPCFR